MAYLFCGFWVKLGQQFNYAIKVLHTALFLFSNAWLGARIPQRGDGSGGRFCAHNR